METRDKSTITGGLGLEEKFFEEGQNMVKEAYMRTDTVSEMLEELAKDVRDESLGKMEAPITSYEKKLVFVGFLSGILREKANSAGQEEVQKRILGLLGGLLGGEKPGGD